MAPQDDVAQRLTSRFGRAFRAGDVLFEEGSPATEAYLLQEGRVRLIKRAGGVERGLRVLRPGDFFGEGALVPGSVRSSTAIALGDGAALALAPDTLGQVLETNAAVGGRVVQQLVRRLIEAEDQIELSMLRDGQARIVLALLKAAQHHGDGAALALSPLDLSTRVGLDVDTVKRVVQELRDQGYVRVRDERVEVPDPAALRELSSLLALKQQIRGAAPGE
ncbi:MAG: Crp/Fnr family transcriptional regulator [Polyangiaceae bacterium]|nr:Crp/Fnr family transcriptional regulator [Polyangiaceae bacterium]